MRNSRWTLFSMLLVFVLVLSACTAPSKHVKGTPLRVAGVPCLPGKYMYFGWEDRPPGYGWTDGDYDDIRVIVECPKVSTTTTTVVRLIE